MSQGYIYGYLKYNNDPATKGYRNVVVVLIATLLFIVLFFLLDPINLVNKAMSSLVKQKEVNVLITSDNRKIEYTGKYPYPVQGLVATPYGQKTEPITNKKVFHNGIDFAGLTKAPVIAIEGGIVTDINEIKSGYSVTIKHKDFYTYYSSLESIEVTVGENISQGRVLGKTGGEPSDHMNLGINHSKQMHFELRKNSTAESAVDPTDYIN